MPELPEVETVARELRSWLPGKKIQTVEAVWPRSLELRSAGSLEDRSIKGVGRHAKYLLLRLDRGYLVVHLRMTGQLLRYDTFGEMPEDPYIRVVVRFQDGTVLCFRDVRKFGRMYHVNDLNEVIGHVGTDALDEALSAQKFFQMLRSTKMNIKAMLMSQKYISGLGNIYVDEGLFRAKIHPARPADRISSKKAVELFEHIREVLSFAIVNMGSTISDYRDPRGVAGSNQLFFKVYDRAGLPCPDCGTTIEKIRFAGRGTHLCPKCQKKGR